MLIALSLIFARFFGYVLDKIKQPAVIGEIFAGLILGGLILFYFNGQIFSIFDQPIVMPTLSFESEVYNTLSEIGILFMLFISGMHTSITKLKKMGKQSAFVAIGGVVVPLTLGILIAMFYGFTTQNSIIIGLILVATSVGITVRTFLDLNILDSNIGMTILGSAVIDDVIGIILLAFFLGTESTVLVGVKIALFFFVFLYLGLKIIDKILDLGEKIHLPKALLSISLAILLLFSFFATRCGITGIIGAFIAGIIIGQNVKSSKIVEEVQTIGYGFFIPLFFVKVGSSLWTGVTIDPSYIVGIFSLTLVVIIVAILGKIIGCAIGAKLSGINSVDSLKVGVGMVPRMELALIIVSSAISSGLITSIKIQNQILMVTVILTVVTTLITPILIKILYKKFP